MREKEYEVTVGSLTRAGLESYLANGQPVIAHVWTAMLDHCHVITSR